MTTTEPNLDKTTLRRQLLRQRQQLSPNLWRQQSQQLCAHLQASPLFTGARTVLGYFSMRQEPDLEPLFRAAPAKIWGFPRCQGTRLIWHAWQPGDPVQSGVYGIQEPHFELPRITPEQVDLILVPAIACDRRGYRLGYGGGFYDRLFAHPAWQMKPTIGIVFASACLPILPIDPWDQPLSALCTETGLLQVYS